MDRVDRKKKKVGIISLGCPRNLVDSELLLGSLKKKGYVICDGMHEADIGIINTCAFIEEAKQESIDTILECIKLKKQGRLKKLIVTGCLPQRYSQELVANLKEIDALTGVYKFNHTLNRFRLTPAHYAYVKISEGCSNKCSYCVIPKIKGKFRSRDKDSIKNEIIKLDKQGVVEINFIGQDISLYGKDLHPDCNLTDLLKESIKLVKNIKWIRLLYLHPAHIEDSLIDLIAQEPLISKYVDLPIQHINDRILKSMNRGINRQQIIALIEKLRKQINNLCLRTSIIVGFPGETDKEFEELLDFIKEVKFDRLGAFIYSPEEGTPAYGFVSQVPDKIKKERFRILMSTQQEISGALLRRSIGQTLDVLVDEKDQDNGKFYLARSCDLAPEVDGIIYVQAKKFIRPGSFIKVKIIDTYEYDLVAQQL